MYIIFYFKYNLFILHLGGSRLIVDQSGEVRIKVEEMRRTLTDRSVKEKKQKTCACTLVAWGHNIIMANHFKTVHGKLFTPFTKIACQHNSGVKF